VTAVAARSLRSLVMTDAGRTSSFGAAGSLTVMSFTLTNNGPKAIYAVRFGDPTQLDPAFIYVFPQALGPKGTGQYRLTGPEDQMSRYCGHIQFGAVIAGPFTRAVSKLGTVGTRRKGERSF
jgi:hypothetical protein